MPAATEIPYILSKHDGSTHPAELIDGVPHHVNNSLGRPIHPTAEGRANFHRWFKGSKAVDHHGRPLVLYHGTTKNFATFSLANGNPENDHGVGIYASSSRDDVNHNYATGDGPDLKNKIEQDFEKESYDVDDDQHDALRAHIAARYKDHDGATLPIYVRMKNPIIIDHGRSTHIPSSKVKRILKSYEDQAASGDHDDIKHAEAAMQIMDHHDGDGVEARHFIELVKGSGKPKPYHGYGRPEQDPPLAYVARTDDGKISGNEVVRKGFEDAGYDGIIDKTAGTRFNTMAGTDEDTTHYIAFDPKQVKSAIGNKGKFSKRKANVTEHLLARLNRYLFAE